MTDAPLSSESQRLRTAATTGTKWLEHLQLWRPEDVDTVATGAHETAVILLRGTFDLMAGTTSWPARGARQSELAGRPMAVFLPPETSFRVGGGAPDGEILMISARQPEVEEVVGKEALSHKPLLPLAGSGKAFDPATGEWKPEETFATAAESLPPRRFAPPARCPLGWRGRLRLRIGPARADPTAPPASDRAARAFCHAGAGWK